MLNKIFISFSFLSFLTVFSNSWSSEMVRAGKEEVIELPPFNQLLPVAVASMENAESGTVRLSEGIESTNAEFATLTGLETVLLRSRIVYIVDCTNQMKRQEFAREVINELAPEDALSIYAVACLNAHIQDKYRLLMEVAARDYPVTAPEYEAVCAQAKRSKACYSAYQEFVNDIDTALLGLLCQIQLAQNQEKVRALSELQNKFESIKLATEKGLTDDLPEPRLWHMNHPHQKQLLPGKKHSGYHTVSLDKETTPIIGTCPLLAAYYVPSESLNLDFVLLEIKALEALKKTTGSAAYQKFIDRARRRLLKARDVCKSWGIKDAETRKIPHNFKNGPVLFGAYEVVFQDGKVLKVQQDGALLMSGERQAAPSPFSSVGQPTQEETDYSAVLATWGAPSQSSSTPEAAPEKEKRKSQKKTKSSKGENNKPKKKVRRNEADDEDALALLRLASGVQKPPSQ